MPSQRPLLPWIVLALGGLLIVGVSQLPIDQSVVKRHTVEKLARKGIASLAPKDATATLAVRLKLAGEAGDAHTLRGIVESPAAKDADGTRRPIFEDDVSASPALSPTLELQVKTADGTVSVSGELATAGKTPQKFKSSARLGTWLALLPPLVALILAIAFRKVLLALGTAVFVGATLLHGGNPLTALWIELKGVALGLLSWVGVQGQVDGYVGQVLSDAFNLQILGFTFALVGLVSVVARMGGTRGLVDLLSGLARGPRSAQAVTSLMGTAIFFDDYANTVVVGTTGRSLTDRHRVSREKLAYIVDSTAAPVAGIALISTWIGYEVGLFEDALASLAAVPDMPSSGYEMFFAVLPMRFYCFFALALVFLSAWTGRDLGPMYTAELRARRGQPVPPSSKSQDLDALEKPGVDAKARNALVPIGVVLFATLGWIIWGGSKDLASFSPFKLTDWKAVFESSYVGDNSAFILLGAAVAGSLVALAMAVGQRLLTPKEAGGAYLTGLKTLFEAAMILILAWSIKSVCDNLGTGMAMVALVGDSLPSVALPVVIFALSGLVAFATGTSWGTMALVLPVAAPLSATLSGEPLIVLACMGAVLDGAIWGDHCSPISDTTVLSSTASGCPHLSHVRTQIPYSLLAMFAAGGVGYVGVAAGLPIGLSYPIGLAVMVGGLLLFGRNPDRALAEERALDGQVEA